MERIANRIAEQLLQLWYKSTPTDYLWLGVGILVVGWIISRSTHAKYL